MQWLKIEFKLGHDSSCFEGLREGVLLLLLLLTATNDLLQKKHLAKFNIHL